MIFVSAGDATEGGLVRPVLCRHVSAGETGPARVSGIDPDQTSSPPRKLIFQKGKERPPSPGQDGAVQAGLLPDVASWVLPGATGASGHVPDLQILDNHDGLGFADRSRGLVEKIQTHVGDPFVGSRHPDLLLPEMLALRSLPVFPGELTLLPDELFFRLSHGRDQLGRRVDPETVRGRGKRPDTEIHPNLGAGPDFRLRTIPFGLQGDGPPARLPGHGGVSEIAFDRPGDPELDPSHLREEDPGKEMSSRRIPGRKVEFHREGIGVPERISLALPLEPGESLGILPVQGFPKGPVEVLQGLLLGVDRSVGKKLVFLARPPEGQEPGQVPVGQERDPGVESGSLEVERLVPDEPDAPRVAGQENLLIGRRNKPEFERLKCFPIGHYTWSHGQVN